MNPKIHNRVVKIRDGTKDEELIGVRRTWAHPYQSKIQKHGIQHPVYYDLAILELGKFLYLHLKCFRQNNAQFQESNVFRNFECIRDSEFEYVHTHTGAAKYQQPKYFLRKKAYLDAFLFKRLFCRKRLFKAEPAQAQPS